MEQGPPVKGQALVEDKEEEEAEVAWEAPRQAQAKVLIVFVLPAELLLHIREECHATRAFAPNAAQTW